LLTARMGINGSHIEGHKMVTVLFTFQHFWALLSTTGIVISSNNYGKLHTKTHVYTPMHNTLLNLS